MAHNVICKICGKQFDRDKIQAVKCGNRRYAHYTCYPEGEKIPLPQRTQEESDLIKLKSYINYLYGKKANWALIMTQIKEFQQKDNYTLTGILKTLKYFYEIKHGSVENSNYGIGIVKFCYQDATNYYYNLFLINEKNKEVQSKNLNIVKEIEIEPPSIKKKKRLFKF